MGSKLVSNPHSIHSTKVHNIKWGLSWFSSPNTSNRQFERGRSVFPFFPINLDRTYCLFVYNYIRQYVLRLHLFLYVDISRLYFTSACLFIYRIQYILLLHLFLSVDVGGWGFESNREIGSVPLRASEAVCEREASSLEGGAGGTKISCCSSCCCVRRGPVTPSPVTPSPGTKISCCCCCSCVRRGPVTPSAVTPSPVTCHPVTPSPAPRRHPVTCSPSPRHLLPAARRHPVTPSPLVNPC